MSESPSSEQILRVATQLWAERGYQNTTMKDLARALKISVGELHRRFPSKQDLALSLYEHINQSVSQRVRGQASQGKIDQRLREFLEVKFEVLTPFKSCLVGLMQEAVDPHSRLNPLSESSAEVLDMSLELFEEMVTQSKAARGDDAKRMARCLWVAHLTLLGLWVQDQTPDSELTQRLVARFAKLPTVMKMGKLLPGLNEVMETVAEFVDQRHQSRIVVEESEESNDTCDIAVIGAGPTGLLYACWLKLARPQTDVVVLESKPEVGYKVGESTLSGLCKALRSIGISHQVQQRLFFPKNGLGFFTPTRTNAM